MFNENHRTKLRTHGVLVGRILMGLLFFSSGVNILVGGVSNTVGFYESLGVPLAGLLVWVALLIKLGAGGALMLGYKVEHAALALIVFTLASIFFAHMDPEDMNLWKNLAIIGGLLYAMAYGAGDGWKVGGSHGGAPTERRAPNPQGPTPTL